ncbi:MAG: NUDIX domain-containing protein [Candidatus Shapirobacteria bacterium]|jgi:NAD+ diphosphatase
MEIVDEKLIDLNSHGVVALIKNQDKFLLIKESRDLLNGHFGPPHGRVNEGETDEVTALVREVKEEVGLNVIPIKKLLTIPADTKVKTVSFWLVEVNGNMEVSIDPNEASEYGWYTPEEALKLTLYPGTKMFFEMVVSGKIILS